jgi:predicted nucleic-acid-binding protein
MDDLDILERVLLLAIYKKEEDEKIDEVLEKLINSGAFLNLDEARDSLKVLRDKKYIIGDSLSMIGVVEAKRVEDSFKLK